MRAWLSVLAKIGVPTVICVLVVAALASAFTPSEKEVIQNLRARITALETALATVQSDQSVMAADIDMLNENQLTLDGNIRVVDEGLKGLVAEDGPIAQIDRNLAYTQSIVFEAHPQIDLTGITPIVTCNGTSCTVDVEWHSDPPATGQVEWGETIDYGNLTIKEQRLLDYHKQRVGVFPQDGKTYHFRILAETPEAVVEAADAEFVLG